MTYDPTPEQTKALDLFLAGADPLVVQAGAGAGKTSTLTLLAQATPRDGAYIAFNKAIVVEAGAKMPGNVTCSTAHSLAFRAVGRDYAHRLRAPRMKANEVARRLGIDAYTVTTPFGRKRLAPGFLAGVVNRTIGRFCQTADEAPGTQHVPYLDGIDLPTPDGRRTYAANREVALHLAPAITKAWADLTSTTGALRFGHDHYLKIWHLSGPRIAADFILFDEAQDANPVLLAIVDAQTHAQRVYVGDSQQAIYGFTGAVDALDRVSELDGARTAFLTQSFRFGPAIAAEANRVLRRIDGAVLRIKGTPTISSVVGPVAQPDVTLVRTNATAVRTALDALDAGQRPHIVGGAEEVVTFAKGAKDLMTDGWTSHPELACFSTWDEVTTYVREDQQGEELRLLVDLVEKFTPEVIIDALGRMAPETDADVVISTAHKAKGREWNAVTLAGDFPNGFAPDGVTPKTPSDDELRLIYVAVTRARRDLDLGPAVTRLLNTDEEEAAGEAGTVAADLGAPDADPFLAELDEVITAARAGRPAPAPQEAQDAPPALDPGLCPRCQDPATRRPNGLIGAHRCTGEPEAQRVARFLTD